MKTKNSYIVSEENAGERLDKYLSSLEEVSSRNYAKLLIEQENILINGKQAKSSYLVKTNDEVTVLLPEINSEVLKPYALKLEIVYEDKDILVVNKPSGLVVHPAAGHQQDTLVNALIYHTQDLSMKNELRPGIVHRIDKETSGLLVVAKNDLSHERLAQQFKDKTTHRVYYAVTKGGFAKPNGIVSSFLARHMNDRKKYASVKINNKIITNPNDVPTVGKWAVTHYSKLKDSQGYSYVKLRLETGRTHQIRVHMTELGHCLVGDTVYGFSVKTKNELKINRFYLHAAELGFIHPTTNENMLFKIDWPEEDQIFLKSLGFKDADIKF